MDTARNRRQGASNVQPPWRTCAPRLAVTATLTERLCVLSVEPLVVRAVGESVPALRRFRAGPSSRLTGDACSANSARTSLVSILPTDGDLAAEIYDFAKIVEFHARPDRGAGEQTVGTIITPDLHFGPSGRRREQPLCCGRSSARGARLRCGSHASPRC